MRSTFFGLELTKRALFAQQRAMDVASHNIANANNPVYSRQRAEMQATAPYASPGSAPAGAAGQVGTGVWVTAVQRLRDRFLDDRIRREGALDAQWHVQRDVLEQVERLLAEPSENGLRVALDRFWQALQDLSVQPESLAVREVVVQRGEVLAATVRQLFGQLQQLRLDIDRTVELKVREVNDLAQQLAELNGQIRRVAASGQRPNDLLDQRDGLLERLSRLVPVSITYHPVGPDALAETVSVRLGGLALVDGEAAYRLEMVGPVGERTLRWEDQVAVSVEGGEIGAYLQLRGTATSPTAAAGVLPELLRDLDTLVRELVTAFNAQHRSGVGLDNVGNRPFFTPDTADPAGNAPSDADGDGWIADDLTVDAAIVANPAHIAAAQSPNSPGDGSNALKLAGMKSAILTGLGGTAPDFYAAVVGRLGVRAQQAQTMADNQELVLQQLRSIRESVSGVSLDEEMADLVRFEHAYGAAARAMTALDEVLDTLINRTGLVGR